MTGPGRNIRSLTRAKKKSGENTQVEKNRIWESRKSKLGFRCETAQSKLSPKKKPGGFFSPGSKLEYLDRTLSHRGFFLDRASTGRFHIVFFFGRNPKLTCRSSLINPAASLSHVPCFRIHHVDQHLEDPQERQCQGCLHLQSRPFPPWPPPLPAVATSAAVPDCGLMRTGVVGAEEAGAAWGAGVVQHEVARAGRGSEVVGHVVVGTSAGAGQGVWVVGPELIGVDVAWCRI